MNRKQRRQAARQARKAGKFQPAASGTTVPVPEEQNPLEKAFSLHQAGDVEAAAELYRQVLEEHPEQPDALHLLGVIHHSKGDNESAIDLIQRSIASFDNNPTAHNNLGGIYQLVGRLEEAVACHRHAIELDPNCAEAYSNLGNVLQKLGGFEEAEAACRKSLEINPNYAGGWVNLGEALRNMGRLDKAEAACRKALEIQPGFLEAQATLGNVLLYQGRLDEALVQLETALNLSPDQPKLHFNRSMALLGLGRLEEGWREYEFGLLMQRGRDHLKVFYPQWDGEPLDGKTILACAEQGIGDEILFASCLPDLIASAGHCVIHCEPRLERLFQRSFPAATVRGSSREDSSWLADAPPIDCFVPMASLNRHFRPSIESFPKHDGYLVADANAGEGFAARLAALGPGLKVGVSWRSMRESQWFGLYTNLHDWKEILTLPGVQFVNLQYDDSAAEVAEVNGKFGVQIHDFPELDLLNDFDGTAALIAELDLVIAPNNTVHGLAGALGVPVWVLNFAGNWCMFGTDGLPMLPSARVYLRECGVKDWADPLNRVARDLKKLAGESGDPS